MSSRPEPRRLVLSLIAGLAVGLLIVQAALGPLMEGPTDGSSEFVAGGNVSAIRGYTDRPGPVEQDRAHWEPPANETRANVIVIITDDHTWASMSYMPLTMERLFEQGVSFEQGYVTTPLCCPSRASVLTGKYAHNHGVLTNGEPLKEETLAHDLHEAGYFTGLTGKYLNSWKGEKRPEFDHWYAHALCCSRYQDPYMNDNGEWFLERGYLTHLLRDSALDFLDQAAERDQPFFLFFTPYTPHNPVEPAPGDEELFVNETWERSPAINEEDVSDKPNWLQQRPRLTEEQLQWRFERSRDQFRALHSLDLSINELLRSVQQKGMAERTAVFFMIDNGVFEGEHRLIGKRLAYQESVNVAFGLRYPALLEAGQRVDELVANIDIAPTIYELAELPIPSDVDGRSLLDLWRNDTDPWRQDLLLEGTPLESPPWKAVHTGRYVYIETQGDRPELYDLERDPYQLESVHDDPAYQDLRKRLEARLQELRPGW